MVDEKKPQPDKTIKLSRAEGGIHLREPLRDRVATRVLSLFSYSLIGTLVFAGMLVLIDAAFIGFKVITPEQRLMTEKVIMTFITATVVQVGTALAAIVLAVFKAPPSVAVDESSESQ